jgi:hypothetical protein
MLSSSSEGVSGSVHLLCLFFGVFVCFLEFLFVFGVFICFWSFYIEWARTLLHFHISNIFVTLESVFRFQPERKSKCHHVLQLAYAKKYLCWWSLQHNGRLRRAKCIQTGKDVCEIVMLFPKLPTTIPQVSIRDFVWG